MLDWIDIEIIISSGNFHQECEWLEYKKAENNIPKDFWSTYSAFANTAGGFILLGISEITEGKKKNFVFSGVKQAQKVQDHLFSLSRSKEKVSTALLQSDDVRLFQATNGKTIIAIYIPIAPVSDRPVHLHQDISQSFIRLHSGDHKLKPEELRSFLSSYTQKDRDTKIIPYTTLNELSLTDRKSVV